MTTGFNYDLDAVDVDWDAGGDGGQDWSYL